MAVLITGITAVCPTGPRIPQWMKTNSSFIDKQYRKFCLNITEIPADIPHDTKQVKIYGNPITKLENNTFQNLSECTNIYLAWNYLQEMERGSFNGLLKLTDLGLGENDLTFLQSGVFGNLPVVRWIGLEYNRIREIQIGTFDGCESLKNLVLKNNSLAKLTFGMFRGLSMLSTLDASENFIEHIEIGVFENMSALRDLSLSSNLLTDLKPGIFNGITFLFRLTLNRNRIEVLRQNVFEGINIKTLDLFGNSLHTIEPGSLSHLSQLTELSLKKNNLSDISWTIFSSEDYQQIYSRKAGPLSIQLSRNPLVCGESLCWVTIGELTGWLQWWGPESANAPQCTNFQAKQWSMVDLDCFKKGNHISKRPQYKHLIPGGVTWVKTYVNMRVQRVLKCTHISEVPNR